MNCMRCGRETPEEQCFCEECLLDMERYPVKPGTVVQLPSRRVDALQRKQPRRKSISPEEQVKVLKRRLRGVCVSLVICLLLLSLAVYSLLRHTGEDRFAIGQNYSSVTTPAVDSGN